jgi:hypothetical protein
MTDTWISIGEAAAMAIGKAARAYEAANWETDKVLWRNAQWAVTTYGIENVAGPYHYFIEKERLSQIMGEDGDWRDHMAQKTWVVSSQFNECFAKAKEIHAP